MFATSITLKQAIVFSVWLLAASLPCVFLSAWHQAPLAGPSTALSIQTSDNTRPHAWHFIDCDCPCSNTILAQLQARKPHPHYQEHIVLLGDSQDFALDALDRSGWDLITNADSAKLAEHVGLVGAPWFMVQDAKQHIIYSGGYNRHQPQSFIPSNDYRILDQLHLQQVVETLPAFGCAVGNDVRRLYDPLTMKYAQKE